MNARAQPLPQPLDAPLSGVDIHGRGPVSLALALFLHRQGLPGDAIGLTIHDAALPAALANRSIALSDGSWQLLGRICELPAAGLIRTVDIAIAGHGLHASLDERDAAGRPLGHVVRYGDLLQCLREAADRLSLGKPANAAPIGTIGRLQVDAEGHSERGETRDFDQSALLAELVPVPVANERRLLPGPGCACEHFKPSGPIALLPLAQAPAVSLVWCDRPARIEALAALDDGALGDALQSALGPAYRRFEPRGRRHVAPLARRRSAIVAGHDRVAIGNAAQSLHPVAGQGLNLGLRDAFVLAAVVGDGLAARWPVARCVQVQAARRRRDVARTIMLTDRLATLGDLLLGGPPGLGAPAAAALALLEMATPLRRLATRQFVFGRR
ncbi:MAG: hypothetical protein R3E68_17970 [Burkholderiaceae bacterium]